MQKTLIFISLFLITGLANAQKVNLDKAEKAIEDGFYERAYKITTDAIEDEVLKKNPLTYYLRAQCLYELSKEDFFIKKNPDAMKDATKMILKGKDKDKDNKYKERFEEFVSKVVETNNELAEEEYKVNKFPKAIKLFTTSFNLNGDMKAFYMIGKSYQMALDTANAKSYYKRLITWYDDSKKSDMELNDPQVDPFIFMSDVYAFKKNYDSANYYLDVARFILGDNNSKVNYNQYLIAKNQIKNQPPSSLMMEVIRKALKYSPADTFLIKKENALGLYLIRNNITGGNTKDADSLIFQFARNKAAKANDPAYDKVKEVDIFLDPYSENVLWKVSGYYYDNLHDKASVYVAKKYIINTASANDTIKATDKDIIARWLKIIQFAKENEPAGYVSLLITQATTDYPLSKELAALKKK